MLQAQSASRLFAVEAADDKQGADGQYRADGQYDPCVGDKACLLYTSWSRGIGNGMVATPYSG